MDLAYGGMVYAIVEASSVGLELVPGKGRMICRLGEMIKAAAREQYPMAHPSLADVFGCEILVFTDSGGGVARNAVVMSNGTLDWSRPETWTGMIDR